MRALLNRWLVAALLVGTIVAASPARAVEPGLYFTAEAGANLSNGSIKGEVAKLPGGATISATGGASFDVGYRINLALGYHVLTSDNFTLGVEVESGFVFNSFSDGLPISIVDSNGVVVATGAAEADFWQVPLLGNVVLSINPDGRWVPFLGVGAGAIYANVDVPDIGSISDTEVAFQGLAGLRYRFNDHLLVGVGYKALFTTFGEGDVINHTISLSFTIRF